MRGTTGFIYTATRKPKVGEKFRPWVAVVSTVPEDHDIVFEITRLRVDDTAELRVQGSDFNLEGNIIRPLTVLRRVPRPNKNKPQIDGMPAERPRCAWCDRLLRPRLEIRHQDGRLSQAGHQPAVPRLACLRGAVPFNRLRGEIRGCEPSRRLSEETMKAVGYVRCALCRQVSRGYKPRGWKKGDPLAVWQHRPAATNNLEGPRLCPGSYRRGVESRLDSANGGQV